MKKIVKTIVKEVHDKSVVCFDISTMIKILEYVRENLKSDDEIHLLATKIIDACDDGSIINMKNFTEITS